MENTELYNEYALNFDRVLEEILVSPFSLSSKQKIMSLIVENRAGSQKTGDDITTRRASKKRLNKRKKYQYNLKK